MHALKRCLPSHPSSERQKEECWQGHVCRSAVLSLLVLPQVAMIATGCIMARVCHTNNCPVGVASQREELRARFPGCPGDLVCLACTPGYPQVGGASVHPT